MEFPPIHLPEPPAWSLLVGSAGKTFVFAAIAAFVLAVAGWLLAPRGKRWERLGKVGFVSGCVSLFLTFVALGTLFVANRLEFAYVWGHGDSKNTIPYRIAGIWAGQQGSFLLWACSAAIFALLAMRGTAFYRRWFTIVYAVFLGAIAGILAYETPFSLNTLEGKPVVPLEGVGLSPALQNYWVTIHPPTIFLGFGALTVLAAYAFAAMATGRMQEWAPMVRPWAITALTLVGLGLCMGGFWAYETLGWGGFWMWDPVENVSFVPWVITAVLVHGIMVQITKKKWVASNLLLGGLPFILFVYGTFLTRSGVLNETSVHSFAEMDRIAHRLLLGFLGGSTIGFLGLWLYRTFGLLKSERGEPEPQALFNREGLYRIGGWLLVALGAGAAIGMSVPMFMALMGRPAKVVEEALYHRVLTWAYIPLMLAMAAGPLTSWRGMGARAFGKRIYGVLCVTLLIMGLAMVAVRLSPWTRTMDPHATIDLPFKLQIGVMPWILLLVGLSVAVAIANVWRITELIKRSKMSSAAFLTHIGVATLMAGLIISRGFEQKDRLVLQEGGHGVALGYFITYKGQTKNPMDRDNEVMLEMVRGDERWMASPGYYYTQGQDGTLNPMTWPHIERHPFYDIYIALNPAVEDTGSEVALEPGKTVDFEGMKVKYLKRTMEGQAGAAGTKFGALIEFSSGDQKKTVHPKMELTSDGVKEIPDSLSNELNVVLKGMDAATGSVVIQLKFARTVYPIDLFYKPMTILVWVGTGIMALAGFLSAYYRRFRKQESEHRDAEPAPTAEPEPELATTR